MMKYKDLKTKIENLSKVKYDTANTISYTQIKMYMTCPHSWELAYARKLKKYRSSIHLIFGTALHETMQHYLSVCFNQSVKAADAILLGDYLRERMAEEYKKELARMNNEHFTTAEEMKEFWLDGFTILDWFKKRRATYFNSKKYDLLGIEVPLHLVGKEGQDQVKFVAYLDVVLWDKMFNRVEIIDIKTSTRGWFKSDKEDESKKAQIILYKKYFNERFQVPFEDVEIKFFILKRKLWEDSEYAQKRIQEFVPSQGKVTMNKYSKIVDDFITTCFNEDGTYNLAKHYPAIEGPEGKNCKYCEFKGRVDLCPAEKRLSESTQ